MRAMDFGEIEYLEKKYGKCSTIHPLPPANLTQPSLVIIKHPEAESALVNNAIIANKEEVKNDH